MSLLHLFNMSLLHLFDVSLLHLSDVTLLHLSDVSLLHLFDVSLLHLFDVSLLHLFDMSLLHLFDVSLLHLFNVSLLHLFDVSLFSPDGVILRGRQQRIAGDRREEHGVNNLLMAEILETVWLLRLHVPDVPQGSHAAKKYRKDPSHVGHLMSHQSCRALDESPVM